jgi:hypothetical protein
MKASRSWIQEALGLKKDASQAEENWIDDQMIPIPRNLQLSGAG